MARMNTTEKVQTCLDFIDQRLDNQAEQTIRIAELIIEDIKNLTAGYHQAMRNGNLKEHSELVRQTQLNWVNQLHEIILEQSNRDLSGQVIQALQKFISNLNQTHMQHLHFELPSPVAREHDAEYQYLSQEEIELLMGQQRLFPDSNDSMH